MTEDNPEQPDNPLGLSKEQIEARIRDGIPLDATDEEIGRLISDSLEEECVKGGHRDTIAYRAEENGAVDLVRCLIEAIGEDPTREGLLDTPDRVIRSWMEIYSGYEVDIGVMLTQFDSEAYDEMIVLEGIEFFSMCEHHMLPFHGRAWVAYVPDKKIVGISKLARLVDAFARRLQNQERITMQVTEALDDYLDPKGSACVVKAHHMCMGCRGVKQPRALMTTSSLTGCFKEDNQTRLEFLSFVNSGK
jgi:GTP cyclohydrolase I